MAAKKKESLLTIEDKLKAALVPEDEQPYPIPKNWMWTRFGVCFRDRTSSDRKLPQKHYEEAGKYAVIDQGQQLIGGYTNDASLVFNGMMPVIVFGDHTRAVKWIDFDFVQGADGVKVFQPEQKLNAKFLYYWMRIIELPDKGYSRHSKFLRETYVPLPPLPEQQRIAEKLESLLGKLKEAKELLYEIPEILQNFRQSVLSAACSGRLTKDWREDNPIQNDLPETWVASRFDQVFDINPSHKNIPIDNNLNISFVPMNLIEEETGKINTNISKKYNEVKNGYTKFIEDDVLFAKITPCMENGKIAIAQNLINGIGCGTTELHVFRPVIKGMSKYLFYFLLQKTIREQAKRRFQGTSGHMRVPSEFFHDLFFPLPPIEEQHEIVRRVESLFKKADNIESHYKSAMELIETLPEIILSKAFRGGLVPQDPNDEPAIKLLEKIMTDKDSLVKKLLY